MPAAARREAPQEPPPTRSPERGALATACEEFAAAEGRQRTLATALDQARRDRMAAHDAVDAAERMVALAQREAPRRAAAMAIGEDFQGEAPAVGEAENELDRRQADYRHVVGVCGVLEAELTAQRDRVMDAQRRRQRAIAEVIAPALRQVAAERVAALSWSEAQSDVLRMAGPLLLPWDLRFWDASNPRLPAVEEPLPLTLWRETLAALEAGDVDHPLPSVK
jgi:hypothetical protein